jgi:hypothetical protein
VSFKISTKEISREVSSYRAHMKLIARIARNPSVLAKGLDLSAHYDKGVLHVYAQGTYRPLFVGKVHYSENCSCFEFEDVKIINELDSKNELHTTCLKHEVDDDFERRFEDFCYVCEIPLQQCVENLNALSEAQRILDRIQDEQ